MIMYTGKKRTIEAVQRIRLSFPAVLFFAIILSHYIVYVLFYFLIVHNVAAWLKVLESVDNLW